MKYEHTQTAPLYLMLIAIGLGFMVAAWVIPEPFTQVTFVISGAIVFVLALSFHHLTIKDEGDELRIGFGPLPLFTKRLRYSDIERVEQARSTILDGWGIHLSPSGGWVWNLWGFDCVDVWYTKGGKVRKLRIGTDDPAGLVNFLKVRHSKAVFSDSAVDSP